jgi:hypothetical protein
MAVSVFGLGIYLNPYEVFAVFISIPTKSLRVILRKIFYGIKPLAGSVGLAAPFWLG